MAAFYTRGVLTLTVHLDDALRIKPVDRLVQHKKIRISRQRHSDPQPLPHTKGEVFRFLFPRTVQPHQMQQFCDTVRRGHPQYQILLAEIFLRRHVQVNGRRFHHCAHLASCPLDFRVCVLCAIQGEAAARRLLQAANQADERGFARAVPADEAIDRTLRDVHVQPIQRREIAAALAESIGFKHIFHVKYLLCLIDPMVPCKAPESGQENRPEILKILFSAGSRSPRPLPHSHGRMLGAACRADCRCAF